MTGLGSPWMGQSSRAELPWTTVWDMWASPFSTGGSGHTHTHVGSVKTSAESCAIASWLKSHLWCGQRTALGWNPRCFPRRTRTSRRHQASRCRRAPSSCRLRPRWLLQSMRKWLSDEDGNASVLCWASEARRGSVTLVRTVVEGPWDERRRSSLSVAGQGQALAFVQGDVARQLLEGGPHVDG